MTANGHGENDVYNGNGISGEMINDKQRRNG